MEPFGRYMAFEAVSPLAPRTPIRTICNSPAACRQQDDYVKMEPCASSAGLGRMQSAASNQQAVELEEEENEEGVERWTASLITQGSFDAAAHLKDTPSAAWQSARP